MSFLYPLFLAGVATVSLPIVLHLIRRHARKHVTFSSLMFLTASPPRLRHRSRVEQWPLLLLRCLMLCLLAMIFARPFWQEEAENAAGLVSRRFVLLVDSSASMQREDLWDQAMSQVSDVLEIVTDRDRVCLIRFDHSAEVLTPFDTWAQTEPAQRRALAEQAFQAQSPSWHRTMMGQALAFAAETLEEDRLNESRETAGSGQVVLISDMQQGSDLEALRGYTWPEGVSLKIHTLVPRKSSNVTVQQIAQSDQETLSLRFTNVLESVQDQFVFTSSKNAQRRTDVYVPAGHSSVVSLPVSTLDSSGTVRVAGDDHAFDNTLYLAMPWDQHRTLLYLGPDDPNDPEGLLFYLNKALGSDTTRSLKILPKRSTEILTDAELLNVQAVVVGEVLSSDRQAWLVKALEAGRLVILAMTSPEQVATLRALTGNTTFQATQVTADGYAMLSRLDFDHPILHSFVASKFSDFTRIHVWQYCRVTSEDMPNARVLAWLDDDTPAWLAWQYGRGLLLASTFTWMSAHSDLALSSKFVPWLYGILDYGGVLTEKRPHYYVGDSVPLPLASNTQTVLTPSGTSVAVASDQRVFVNTNEPGLYRVGADAGPRVFAVNLHPRESRTSTMPPEDLEQLGVPLQGDAPVSNPTLEQKKRHSSAVVLERGQKVWRSLLCALLIVCFLEMGLAGWLTRSGSVSSGDVS